MEILQNLWNVLTTEDENLIKYLTVCMGLLEGYVYLKLFTSVLNLSYTTKQQNIYFACIFICLLFSTFIIPNEYSVFFATISLPIIIKFVFKTTIMKGILSELLILIITLSIETLFIKLHEKFIHISIYDCINIPIYRISSMLTIYLAIYIISKIILFFKVNINIFEKADHKTKKLLIVNLLFIILCIFIQFYLLLFFSTSLPVYIALISLFSLLAYAFISIYSIIKSINLEIAKAELEQSKNHNKTLELLYSNTRAFKHDLSNMLTALGGYISTKNLEGLEKYYQKMLEECHIDNNLSTLNPNVINNPAIYNILASKYYEADKLGITIDMEVFINLNQLKLNTYDFCKILGILLDNAIEAAAQCEEKQVHIALHDVKSKKFQILEIENTYSNKNIIISQLQQKGYTTKTENKESHGIGLWQVSRILKKHNNAILETSKNENYFKQELAIYY